MGSENQGNSSSEEVLGLSLVEAFKSHSQLISKMLRSEGIRVEPFLPGLPHFSKLANETKQGILAL